MKNPHKHWSFLKFAGLLRAMRLRRKARQDEQSGFLFAAAMEWREAAGLCGPIEFLADRYWLEWERIMHLPRQLAAPIGATSIASVDAAPNKTAVLTDQPVRASVLAAA